MCGVSGAVGLSDPSILDQMARCLTHRGPDNIGTHLDDEVMLANNRLSIIDIEGGDQPVYNEDGDVVVVYNGEIYNYQPLRADLEAAGHQFSTATDTEVLVHGYEEYGTDIFTRLNGMFAVALWDDSRERLLLARDRAGIKPLYFAPVEGGIMFASEPKSLLQTPWLEPAVDTQALEYFLQLRYSPPDTTLFSRIETLLPGQYLDISREDGEWDSTETQYWSPLESKRDPPSNPVTAVENVLENAVERQLMSDVPVGFYLSGGLDTSSIVALASDLQDEPIHTFCMGFNDQEWDERADAQVVADHFGTNHHEVTLDQQFMEDFPEMIWHADEPKRNLYPYYVAEAMSEHVRVALGGLGADELFGGYVYRYNRLMEFEQIRQTATSIDNSLVNNVAGQITDWQLEHGGLDQDSVLEEVGPIRHIDDPARLYVLLNSTDVIADIESLDDRIFGPELAVEQTPADTVRDRLSGMEDRSLTEQALNWDFTLKMPDDFLLVEDRMSMAHSLESRVPFLDNEVIDVVLSLPHDERMRGMANGNVGKAVLRRAMRDRLPDAVFEKDKQGFTMPTYPFVRDEMLPHAKNILDNPAIVRNGLVQADYLDAILTHDCSQDLVNHYKMLWKLVALEIWYQMYIVEGANGPEAIEHYYS